MNPANWFNNIQPQNPGDVVIIPAGTGLAPVTLDLVSPSGNIQTVGTVTINVAGPNDTVFFSGVTIDNSTITAGDGASAGNGTTIKIAGSKINGLSLQVGAYGVVTLNDTNADSLALRLGDHATLNLKGNTATASQITQNNGRSSIIQSVAGGSLVINAGGTVTSDATTWFDAVGGQTTINIGPLVNPLESAAHPAAFWRLTS